MLTSYTETSVDQAWTPVIALCLYLQATVAGQKLATQSQHEEAAALLHAHAHWWIRNDYHYTYTGEVWSAFDGQAWAGRHSSTIVISSPSAALKIPLGLHIAWVLTGRSDDLLISECTRLLRKAVADGALRMHRGPRGETKDLYHWARMYAYCLTQPELRSLAPWSRLLRECWVAAKSTRLPTGLCLGQGNFLEDGTVEPFECGPSASIDDGYWRTDAGHPASTAQMAAFAMFVHSLGPCGDADAIEAGEIGRQLLSRIDESLLYCEYDFRNPARQAPPAGHLGGMMLAANTHRLFNTRTVVFWLEAYWMGVLHGALHV